MGDLKHSNVRHQFFKFAIPSMLGMLIVSMQIMVDGIFLSKGVGTYGLAAVNLSMPLINFLLSICMMIVSGGVVITGIAKGANQEQMARGYTTLTLILLVSSLTLISSVFLININRVCYLLGANEALLPYVRSYLKVFLIGSVFYSIPNFTEAFSRINGKPNLVFVSGCVCLGMNVLLDYLFVLRFGWGMQGAAIATCIANSSAAAILFPFVKMARIAGRIKEIKSVFFNGSSEMLTSVSAAISTYVFNIILMKYIGAKGVAALTIVFYINMIVNMSLFGLSQALQPLVSYNLGAKNLKNIRMLLHTALFSGAAIGIGIFIIVFFTKASIIRIFTNSDIELFDLAYLATSIVTLHYLFSFYNIIVGTFHTAIAKPIESAVIAVCRSVFFTIGMLMLLPWLMGTVGIWLSVPVAEFLTLFVSFALLHRSMKQLKLHCTTTTNLVV